MRRFTRNLVVDGLAFTGFLLLTTTGILMRYLLPPGSGRRTAIWGLDRHGWGELHFWIAVALLGLLSFHLVLHRSWIAAALRGRPREGSGMRVALGLTGLAAVVALALAPLLAPPERIAAGASGSVPLSQRGEADQSIHGQLTLRELEARTGVPVDRVLRALGLPGDIARDRRLGRLCRQYGCEMDDIRRILDEYRGSE